MTANGPMICRTIRPSFWPMSNAVDQPWATAVVFYFRALEPGTDFIRTPGPIMFQSPGDSFVNGSLLGLCVEVPLAAIVSLAMHGVDWNGQRIAMLIATPVLIACIALLTRPVAFSTVWKHKRSPFLLDDNVRASIYGRLCGIAIGVVFGIMVATTFA
ncbi:hypothetical protein LGN17_35265 [Burkholderia sp. AU30280]|uniref:hypothetical protein n=1 Tax=Burkholderia sp. AU30280 TaxID=2879628 RepID=UPI001CF51A5A|nr:hypothetical protein [Burkholderia sp. AU30280]MCA8277747.1 hypothetical protein [Burkholderia sp. AU30280]